MLRVAINKGSGFKGSGFKGFEFKGSEFKGSGLRVQPSRWPEQRPVKSEKEPLACGILKVNNEYRIMNVEVRYFVYIIKKIEQSESPQ